MPLSSLAETGNVPDSWRSLSNRLTDAQIEHLAAMERHPAYFGRPRLVLLEALEYVHPGWAADYMAGRAVTG